MSESGELPETLETDAATPTAWEQFIDALDDGVCVLQRVVVGGGGAAAHKVVCANSAFGERTGAAVVVGRLAHEVLPDIDRAALDIVSSTGVSQTRELRNRVNGDWLQLQITRVRSGADVRLGVLVRNVNAAKEAEAARERVVSQARADCREAERGSTARDRVIQAIAHELRAPLTAIVGWSDVLLADDVKELQHRKGLEIISRNARLQATKLDTLLDFSRLFSGRFRLEPVTIELHRPVEAAIARLRNVALAKGVRIQPVLASEARVLGEPAKLEQLAVHLLENAIHATPAHGRVQVVVLASESSVEFIVADTGVGLAPEQLAGLFQAFADEDVVGRKGRGMGLGLWIVQELVKLHGGVVDAVSEGHGKGATFRVRLPAAVVEQDGRPPAARRERFREQALRGRRVVVVEDEPDARELLDEYLRLAGAEVSTAASARAGLELIEQVRPDIVVSDIGMPGEDGYWLADQLRRSGHGLGRAPVAVALTAFSQAEDRARALRAGFVAHITKPVDPAHLVVVLSRMLEDSDSHGQSQADGEPA